MVSALPYYPWLFLFLSLSTFISVAFASAAGATFASFKKLSPMANFLNPADGGTKLKEAPYAGTGEIKCSDILIFSLSPIMQQVCGTGSKKRGWSVAMFSSHFEKNEFSLKEKNNPNLRVEIKC